jgi:hypothetical protein
MAIEAKQMARYPEVVMRNGKLLYFIAGGLGGLAVATTVTTRNAQAYPFYVDWQTGLAQFRGTNTLFNSGTSESTGYGLGANLGLFYGPWGPSAGTEFQIGISQQYISASQGASNFAVLAPMAMARIQLMALYASVGFAPYVWYRAQPEIGIMDFTHLTDAFAYQGEVGALYSVTPKFSMGGALNLTWFSLQSGLLAAPASNLVFVMRFYFGDVNIGSNTRGGKPLEFHGWRYLGK